MPGKKVHDDVPVWMTGTYKPDDLVLKRAIVREGLSKLTETTVEFKAMKKGVKPEDILGLNMSIAVETTDGRERQFTGIVTSIENRGFIDGFNQYVAEVRPWLWMLTRATNNRIFQEKTAVQIIEEVFGDHGFSDFEKKLTETYKVRPYCVQYRETDYDFVCRLMEEEGIYFFFDNGTAINQIEKMILCDGMSSHKPMPDMPKIEYFARHTANSRRPDNIGEFASCENVTTGKVTLNDFDMLLPTAELMTVSAIEKGKHSYKKYEHYHYPGHYRKDTELGDKRARVRMEAEAVKFLRHRGSCNLRSMSNGYTFSMDKHPEVSSSTEFLVVEAVHYVQNSADFDDNDRRRDVKGDETQFPKELEGEVYTCVFEAIPKNEQYRAPLLTPWPRIPGLHTAIVVGKAGEEIWTDEHGRIKVQFHWDRVGQDDENSTCWIRVATPWSGKGWGLVAIPRMGQEVVIQFEEGDPDRPICTGMLWNEDTKPAWEYPANATQLGIRTRSSKSGGADNYNELMFEDKIGEEFMRVQAEKDHQFLIKNKSVVTIGQPEIDAGDHDEDGCLSEVIRNHVTRTIQEGSHYYTIQQGDEEFKIETGSQTIEIATDKTQTITQNYSTTVEQGDHTTEVSSGDKSTSVSMGNISVSAGMGKIEMEAMQSIELKVGGSSIKIEPAQITVKSAMVKIEGSAMAELKSGGMTKIDAGGMTKVSGGIVKIN